MKKKLMGLLALVCAIAVPAASAVSSSSAAPTETAMPAAINYRVCHGPAPIRTAPESSAPKIGELQNGEVFGATLNSFNNFDKGYAYGSVHAEGFMNRNYEC